MASLKEPPSAAEDAGKDRAGKKEKKKKACLPEEQTDAALGREVATRGDL